MVYRRTQNRNTLDLVFIALLVRDLYEEKARDSLRKNTGLWPDHVVPDRISHEFGERVKPEFTMYCTAVGFHGSNTYKESGCYFFVAFTLRQKLDDIYLAGSQRRIRHLIAFPVARVHHRVHHHI